VAQTRGQDLPEISAAAALQSFPVALLTSGR
jgi:hypothetical protein